MPLPSHLDRRTVPARRAAQTPTIRLPVLAAHIAAVALIQSTSFSLQMILPVIARKRFEASEWQTLLITAAPTALFVVSIFWNDLFSRRSFKGYLAVFWIISSLPLMFIAFAHSYWMLCIPQLIACLAAPGYYPLAGELFKRLYPDSSRGRVYAIIWGSSMVGGIFVALAMGRWLNHDREAFRTFIPIITAVQAIGGLILLRLASTTGLTSGRAPRAAHAADSHRLARLVQPIIHMREILRADPIFLRYEAAYMTYGIGWMVAYALLPLLATDKLGLRYDQYTESTQIPYQIAIIAMIGPAGWLLDRLGAIRSVGLSFALLSLYPLGLIFADTAPHLAAVSVIYGIAHAGASIGWMLGPVALAPSPQKVPQYVAIHATLVGLRGAIFQGLGVLLLKLTGSFTWPLALAATAYLWSAVQMWRLHARMPAARAQVADAPAAVAAPAVVVVPPAVQGIDSTATETSAGSR